MAVAHGSLGHLRDQGLGVAQQQVQHRRALEFFLDGQRLQPKADPGTLYTARLGVDSPPMNSEMPTMPS